MGTAIFNDKTSRYKKYDGKIGMLVSNIFHILSIYKINNNEFTHPQFSRVVFMELLQKTNAQ